ncbi:nucleotidyltransferase family protein [Phascolarctobacterium sp.]|uniref:tRNA(Met) cytidine acetate ligase n=1 Tax=Phascolarctobacterium sp. TaxID=2049039 RepID=UPI002A804E29|nr:nucleotidyltransferase family protein [Phascolarctobacterium sp.]MDY5044767.1 nucleotidyltransferase family protein [Phascolarctobacterium sp.]
MITATGIIAEYNPFHNGHLYQLREATRLTGQPVVVAMSASFMQRGEPACLSKWLRARLAVENGAALVLELPTAFSLRSAQFFASGGVQLLAATGSVNTLSCGVESPELDFGALAQRITSDAAQGRIRSLLSQGKSYAAACAAVLSEAQQEAGVTAMQASSNEGKAFAGLTKPNDILALEYAKALQATDIKLLFIERRGDGYNDREISGTMSSATAIRQALNNSDDGWQQAVPASVRQALLDNAPGYDAALLWQLLRYKLRLMSVDAIADACQCSEGLENLLKDAAACPSFAEALQLCTSKRYTTSRIRRLFMQLLLDVPRWRWEDNAPAYLRVLAFNDTGRQLLKQMKSTASLPIITGLYRNWPQRLQHLSIRQQQIYAQQLELELKATELWSLLQLNPDLNRYGNDYLISPSYVKPLL